MNLNLNLWYVCWWFCFKLGHLSWVMSQSVLSVLFFLSAGLIESPYFLGGKCCIDFYFYFIF